MLVRVEDVGSIMEKATPDPDQLRLADELGKRQPIKEESPKKGEKEVEEIAEPETNPDARVLDVDYDSSGERYKEWRQVSLEVREYQWPLDGPLTVTHLVRRFQKFGGNPKRWLGDWMRSKQVQEGDRITFEMKVLVEALFVAGTYDQLNLAGLASMEVLARRVQAVVDAYSACPIPDWALIEGDDALQVAW